MRFAGGVVYGHGVVAVDALRIETKGGEFGDEVARAEHVAHKAVELLFVVVHQHAQVAQGMGRGEHTCLPDLAFVNFAIAEDEKYAAVVAIEPVAQGHAPTAREAPCPNEPVVMSTPGVFRRSQ